MFEIFIKSMSFFDFVLFVLFCVSVVLLGLSLNKLIQIIFDKTKKD